MRSACLPAGWECRLPTEAQWEYACRAGSTTRYSFGDDSSELGKYAWFKDNANDVGEQYAHRVGQKQANAWGLRDMHGNVLEWCSDWYAESYPAHCSATDDPTGPGSSVRLGFVARGGYWFGTAGVGRSATRLNGKSGLCCYNFGFRVALISSE